MLSKPSLKLITVMLLIFLSSCSSTKPTNVACDFVVGAGDNALERNENKNKSDIHGNKIKKKQSSDIIEGILNVLGGILTRSVNNDKDRECT